MVVITCMIVSPGVMGELSNAADITDEHLVLARETMISPVFKDNFRNMCGMDIIPEITIGQIKVVKAAFVDALLTNNTEQV